MTMIHKNCYHMNVSVWENLQQSLTIDDLINSFK
jgi:hypothetical protein